MMKINFTTVYYKDNRKYMERHGLVQYEYGQYLEIHELQSDKPILYGEFYNEDDEETCYPMQLTKDETEDFYTVRVPDELLQSGDNILLYISDMTQEQSSVIAKCKLLIEDRPDGEDYDTEEYESIMGQLLDDINELEENIQPLCEYYTNQRVDEIVEQGID